MKDNKPEVSVHLRRLGPDEVLVIVRGDYQDEEPAYYEKLTDGEPVGLLLDPLDDPHRIAIDDGGLYGGEFTPLSRRMGGFVARPPRALIDLLLPDGAAEATYPCQAEAGSHDLYFTLPEGRSTLSLFDARSSCRGARCRPQAEPCTSVASA